jgi:hypothetical protein
MHIYKTDQVYHNDSLVMARFSDPTGVSDILIQKKGRHWYIPPLESLRDTVAGEIQFTFNSTYPFLDDFYTASQFKLYSDSLIEHLAKFDLDFEVFTASLYDVKRGVNSRMTHNVFRLLSTYAAINWEKSVHYEYRVFKEMVLEDGVEENCPSMFVNSTHWPVIMVTNRLKDSLESVGFTGMQFLTLEEYALSTR